jgi:hypothetical protein
MIFLYAEASQFNDGAGHLIPAFADLALTKTRAGPFLIYVPDLKVLGGTVTAAGIVPAGPECGHLFGATPKRCITGVGDPYVELSWSRYFGTPRPSRYPGAFPIPEGLAVSVGFGMVIPIGKYNVNDATLQGLTIGNNLWDFSPIVGFTLHDRPGHRRGHRDHRAAVLEQLSDQSGDPVRDRHAAEPRFCRHRAHRTFSGRPHRPVRLAIRGRPAVRRSGGARRTAHRDPRAGPGRGLRSSRVWRVGEGQGHPIGVPREHRQGLGRRGRLDQEIQLKRQQQHSPSAPLRARAPPMACGPPSTNAEDR